MERQRIGFVAFLLGFEAIAGQVQLEDPAVVHEPVYSGGRGHRFLEERLALGNTPRR